MVGLRALDRAEDVEVLAIGSSLVDLGFDAARFSEVTGKTAYNAGVSGTDVVWQSRYLREVLIPTYAPEAVFWGIRDSLRTKSFRFANSSTRAALLFRTSSANRSYRENWRKPAACSFSVNSETISEWPDPFPCPP